MTISAKLVFRNQASSEDLNQTSAFVVDRCIFNGGSLGLSALSLNITIAPFVATSYDGMTIVSDATETITVIDGKINYIVLFAKYEHRTTATVSLQVVDSSIWGTSIHKDYFITFACVDLSAGGYAGVTATEVTYEESDFAEKLGKGSWKNSVSLLGDLPTLYNHDGDTRMVISNHKPYTWDATTLAWLPSYDSDAALVNYSGGPNWYDGSTNPATLVETQLDKIVTDLSSVAANGGADKLGIGSRSAWLDSTVNPASSIYAAIVKIITDLSSVVANGGSAKVGVGTRSSWLDLITNPPNSVYGAFEKIITDLSSIISNESGASKIGADLHDSYPNTLTAGTVSSQLLDLLSFINLEVADRKFGDLTWAVNWENNLTLTGSESFTSVATDGHIIVACQSNEGNIYYSYDKKDWTKVVVDAGSYFNDIYYADGYWVLVGGSGGTNNLMYTTDPTGAWTANNQGVVTFNAVYYGNGYWVSVGTSGTLYYKITDPTGAWTSNPQGANILLDVEYAAGYWVTVGYNGTIYYKALIPTGAWTSNNQPVTHLYGVTCGAVGTEMVWVAVGDNNTLLSTPAVNPGDVWLPRSSAAQAGATLYDVAYGDGVFCICSTAALTDYRGIQMSVNAATWDNRTIPQVIGRIIGVRYCIDSFVAVTSDDAAAIVSSLRNPTII